MTRWLRGALPSWDLVTTKRLELRKRRGLMLAVLLLTVGLPVLVLGIRLLCHAIDPSSYGPAGTPDVFQALCNVMAEFGFIIAATLGASAGTTDLTEGVFRHLVVTGRSRLALYLARIPAGLSIVLPLVAVAFAFVCLVTCYAGVSQPTTVDVNGIRVPAHLSEAQLKTWIEQHPNVLPPIGAGPLTHVLHHDMSAVYGAYVAAETTALDPVVNEMVKIGLWVELEVGIGFMVGLGVGSLIGQRTVSTILLIALEIIVTPILASVQIPYFLNGQRLVVGIAMDQLRPAGLASGTASAAPRHGIFGGRGALRIPPMPTWAMIAVIVGWIVGWSVIGAWRMMTRDA